MTGDSHHYAPGDRVTIVGGEHPWSGYSGTIVGPMPGAAVGWVVQLDGAYGSESFAMGHQLRTDRKNEEERPPP